MRNRNKTNQLNRTASHRKALMRNLIDQLIVHSRIETTLVKAKELKRYADNFLSKMRKNDLAAKRKAISVLRTKDAFQKLFSDEFIEFLNSRSGGYVRVMRTSVRPGDATRLAIIELTGKYEPKDTKKKAPKKAAEKTVDNGQLKIDNEKKTEEIKEEEKTVDNGQLKMENEKKTEEMKEENLKVEEEKEPEVKEEVTTEEKKKEEKEIQKEEEKKEVENTEKEETKAEAPKVEKTKEGNKPQEEKVEEKPEEPKE